MTDVSRALLLPDVHLPSDRLLKTLAVYWDQLFIPDYVERAGFDEQPISEFGQVSAAQSELEASEVIVREERTAQLPPLELDEVLPPGYEGVKANEALSRLWAAFAPVVELMKTRPEVYEEFPKLLTERDREVEIAAAKSLNRFLVYAALHYMGRVRDSFELSESNHLAPVARSSVSHLASMLGAPSDVPRTEAALLSASIEAFEVDPDTPVDRILAFRDRNTASLGRFRASLVDLSEGLRADAPPTQLLAEARDRYRNRVIPALGNLEEVLKQGRIQFFVRSLLGTTALTLTPVDPMKAVEGGATLVGQTINYSFSRSRMVKEHPFGYLHQVSKELGRGQESVPSSTALQEVIQNPEEKILHMFLGELKKESLGEVLKKLWVPSIILDSEEEGSP